jgi:hypothetical protein
MDEYVGLPRDHPESYHRFVVYVPDTYNFGEHIHAVTKIFVGYILLTFRQLFI